MIDPPQQIHSPARRRTRRACAALLAGVALSLGAVAPAAADIPLYAEFQTPQVTIEYGQSGWSFSLKNLSSSDLGTMFLSKTLNIEPSGPPLPFTPVLSFIGSDVGFGDYYDYPPLAAGVYTFKVTGYQPTGTDAYVASTPVPATLTVTKALLGIELRVLADESNGDNAIVSARFTGRFVDEYASSFYPQTATSPAGSWTISIVDAEGTVVEERVIDRTAGDDVLATSFYWDGAEPGEQYTATASFVPSGTSGANFTVSAANSFNYTAPDAQRAVPTSAATEKPAVGLPPEPDFSVPLWWVILAGIVIAALIAFAIVFAIRLGRLPAKARPEPSPPAGAEPKPESLEEQS